MHKAADINEAGLPLIQAEHGIWLGQQLNPASPFYNAAEVMDIRGPLSAPTFGAALCQALLEAPALHRTFRETPEGPRQFFIAPKPEVVVLDFSAETQPQDMAEKWMCDDLAGAADLTRGPLYQQALIKLADDHHLWYQRIHHIAADGFAFALFSHRVAELYNSEVETCPQGKPLADYTPVLLDDQNYQSSEQRETSRQFWCRQLPQSPRPVSLSRSRVPITDWPLRYSTEINSDHFSRLQNFARTLDANWADVLTAMVAALVYRQTAAEDIILGLPVMGRIGTPALRVPAMIMNIAPLRIDGRGLRTLADWVRKVASEQKLCRPHQRYRYEHLRRDLKAVGGDKRLYGPVVNIMPFDRQLRFGNCELQVRNLAAGPVEDISFAFVLQPDNRLRFDIEANPHRYSEKQLALYQENILKFLENPSQPVQLAVESFAWLAGAELPSPRPSVLQLFAEQVNKKPHAIALVDGNMQISFAALSEKARRFAQGLKYHHVNPGDIVALDLPRGEAAVVSCLGCLMAGAPYVFLDPKGPQARNQRILQDAQPTLVVADKINHTAVSYASLIHTQPLAESECDIPEDTLAYLIYTSGSTGAPKGVMVGRRALAEFVLGAAATYDIRAKDRVLQYAPLHFDASVEEIFVTLCQGATLVIRDESMLDSVSLFLDTCARWKISVLDLPTAYWHELVFYCHSTNTPLPAAVHTVIIGGEAALPERVRQWHQLATAQVRLLNTYGPSEATVVTSCTQLLKDQPISIGAPLPGRQLAVVDRQGRILQRDEAGELVILGGGIGVGYKNMPEVSATRFRSLQFPWLQQAQCGYFTGDRAQITAQGTVEYLGRLDAEVKISGHRINPVEIESAILSLGLAKEVAVVISNRSGEQKSLTAFMVATDEGNRVDVQTLRQQLSALLPAPMLPTRVEWLSRLLQNAAGKVDRKALAALAAADAPSIAPENLSVEEQLVIQTWQQVLGITAINSDDDFFMLGGQSLQTIQVANRLSAALQREIAVTLLFEHPTVRQLASALAQQSMPEESVHIKEIVHADIAHFQTDLLPANKQQIKPLKDCKTVLLTGATGFVGAQLLHQLLHACDATVICFVRASSVENAHRKIVQALAKQRLAVSHLHDKIEILLADLEQPGFDLSREDFQQLALRCDAVLHNAANTSVMRDYQSLRAANVLSTQTLLQIAAIKGVPFHLISTIAVAPATGLPEDFVPWHDGLSDGYQQSKWAAERSVQIAHGKGYNVNVYRLARVVGDFHSAAVNDKDLVWNIAATSVRNAAFPSLPIREPWTPVDLVARFIVANALQTGEQKMVTNPVLNIMPPTAVALQDVGRWLAEAGFPLAFVSIADWCARLAASPHPEDRALLGFFQQRSGTEPKKMILPEIRDQVSRAHLKACNIDLPVIDHHDFNAYLAAAIEQGLIPAPHSQTHHPRGLYEPA